MSRNYIVNLRTGKVVKNIALGISRETDRRLEVLVDRLTASRRKRHEGSAHPPARVTKAEFARNAVMWYMEVVEKQLDEAERRERWERQIGEAGEETLTGEPAQLLTEPDDELITMLNGYSYSGEEVEE